LNATLVVICDLVLRDSTKTSQELERELVWHVVKAYTKKLEIPSWRHTKSWIEALSETSVFERDLASSLGSKILFITGQKELD